MFHSLAAALPGPFEGRLSMRTLAATLLLATGLALAACSTTPTANVLRFHQNQPIGRGTVYIRPADPAMANSLEFQTQADAVAAELRRNGFQPVSNPAAAQFTAVVDVRTTERIGPPRQSGVSVGIGGGFSSGNVGIGTSVQVPVGRTPPPNVATTTTLSVTLLQNPSNQAIWEGRSSLDTEANGQRGTPLTPILAQTLFRDFPGP